MTPSPSPLNLNVSMAPNRDIISPLNLGTITYTDPIVFSTNQITEILVLDSAIPFQRFAATAPFNLSTASFYPRLSEVFPGDDFEDKKASGGFNAMYSGTGNTTANWLDLSGTNTGNLDFDVWKELWDRRVALKDTGTGRWTDSQGGKVTSNWSARDSQAFSPQIDVFSRFNKWFTSVTWMIPDDYEVPQAYTWPVLFIYADRVNKILYNVPGTISADTIIGQGNPPSSYIELRSGSISLSNSIPIANLTGSQFLQNPAWKSTSWRYQISINDGPFTGSTNLGFYNSLYSASPLILQQSEKLPKAIVLADPAVNGYYTNWTQPYVSYKIKLRAVSQDPESIEVVSNSIYVAQL